MRAIVIREPSGIDALRLEEGVPEPAIGAADAMVRVHAVGVNFGLDTLVARGTFGRAGGSDITFPLTPGADIAGVIEDVGAAVTGFQVGDRVVSHFVTSCGQCAYCRTGHDNACVRAGFMGVHRNGGAAELVSVPVRNLRAIPDHLTFAQAAAIPVSFAVAWNMLVELAQVTPNDWVLVLSAGSGLGVAAVQIAKLHGARVVAAAGSAWKLERARLLGADETIDYGRGPMAERIREYTSGRGVDVVIDGNLSQEYWDDYKEAIANRSRIVVAGAAGGGSLNLDVRHFYRRHGQLLGNTAAPLRAFHTVLDQFEARRLRAVIHTELPLAEIRQAHALLHDRAVFGKVVLRPDTDTTT